jgi:DNA-binding winged helix-turn-helix (wHTH) protein
MTVTQIVRTGALAIDLDALTIHVDGREARLTPIERSIVLFLAEHAGRIMPTGRIVAAIWGTEYVIGSMTDYGHILRTHMGRLRAKLGSASTHIECLPRLGYRLVMAADESPATDTGVPDLRLLPDPLRAKIAAGYREIEDANRMLYAETGTTLYRTMAVYAAGRADAMERGVSLLFSTEGQP